MRPSSRKRLVPLVTLAALLAMPTFASAGGGTLGIAFKDPGSFVPANPPERTTPDSVIEWNRQAGSSLPHNVRQDDNLFRSGNASSSFDHYSRRPSAGTFHYYCEAHGSETSGMQGRLRITPLVLGSFPDNSFNVLWASADTNTGSAFDVQYRVNGGDWKKWRNDTTMFQGRFGKNDRPVHVVPGNQYDFRARSEKSTLKPNKRSGWSPPYEATP